jgi:pimeloyl-CoA synthetase
MRDIRPYVERVLAGEQVRYERLTDLKGLGRRWVSTVFYRRSTRHDKSTAG